MEPLGLKIDELARKIDDLQRTIRGIQKIILWTVIVSVVIFMVPLIGLLFVIPQFLANYTGLQ